MHDNPPRPDMAELHHDLIAATRISQRRAEPRPRADHHETLYTAATRTWGALKELTAHATPDCPTCGGMGWTRQRVEHGFAGEETRACHCTGAA